MAALVLDGKDDAIPSRLPVEANLDPPLHLG
jgi:hypothetical protein